MVTGGAEAGQERDHRLVQSVERALTMLEEIAAGDAPVSASEVAARAGVNRGTAWRLLATLEHFQLVEREPVSGRYAVGFGAARIAAAGSAPALVRRARPVLERLGAELDENCYVQVASGRTLLVLDEVRAKRPVKVELADIEVPLHCGSVGKAFLAHLPEPELAEFLAAPMERFTPDTITDPAKLRAELDAVRDQGYAVAYAEHLPEWGGITSVARDVRGRPLAYLNVTVPSYRYTRKTLTALSKALLKATRDLERRLNPS